MNEDDLVLMDLEDSELAEEPLESLEEVIELEETAADIIEDDESNPEAALVEAGIQAAEESYADVLEEEDLDEETLE